MAQKQSASKGLCRKAISPSGKLGDLYSIFDDCFVGKCNLASQAPMSESLNTTQCVFLKTNTNQNADIFRQIVVDDDLRLSVRLKLAPTVGIGVFLNYHRKIDVNTRILHYLHRSISKQLPKAAGSGHKWTNSKSDADISHVVSQIDFGIEALIILQLPDDESVSRIDNALDGFRSILLSDNSEVQMNWLRDKNLPKQLKSIEVTVLSNMVSLTNINRLHDIPSRLTRLRGKLSEHNPINYYLRPVIWIYPEFIFEQKTFHSSNSDLISKVENSICDLQTVVVGLEISFKSPSWTSLNRHLKQNISPIDQQWSRLQQEYNKEIKFLSDLVLNFRRGGNNIDQIEQALNNQRHKALEKSLNELALQVTDWQGKGQVISDIRRNDFEYSNVVKYGIVKSDNKKDLEQKLLKGQQNKRILCCNDRLRRNKSQQFNERQGTIMAEKRRNNNLQLIYADFTYSKCELEEPMILSSPDTKKPKYRRKSPRRRRDHPSVASSVMPQPPSPPPPASTEDTINILLLGESGVGKSTFVNALANYLAFDTFEDARSNSPIVLITISFLITTGDHFEEHIIKFVDFDHSNNENFDNPGQSVTQQCRSYVFTFHRSNGRKVRLIDTPGFGDTRGVAQDELNIEHVLRYIHQLTHLNAICFLLKPNSSQLNLFFRTCLIQLFTLLGPEAQQNISFCFTNARATFYTPGDTAPLLKSMLQSLPMKNIQFKKDNAFCFDNESFRYLVALQNGITFSETDQQEYERSWTNAARESHRFLDYISTKVPVYRMQEGGLSIKEAQFKIDLLIRPMLETIRNLLRNLILAKTGQKNQSIILCPRFLEYTAARCLLCSAKDLVRIDPFSIRPDHPHRFVNDCSDCTCDPSQHIPLNYILKYAMDSDEANAMEQEDMIGMLDELVEAGVEFAHFLIHTARSTKDDPFFLGLIQMIVEESELNSQLAKEIRKIQNQYDDLMNKKQSNKKPSDLKTIYDLILEIEELPPIQEQMLAIKKTREMLMEKYQYDVS